MKNLFNFILFIYTISGDSYAKNPYIKGPPSIIGERDVQKKSGTEGKDIKLTCPVVGNPEPIIEWFKDDETIPDDGWERFRAIKNSLKIKELTPNDQGSYVCKAVNGFGNVHFTFYLTVLASLGNALSSPAENELRMDQVFPISGSTIRKMAGQNVRFKCLAVGDPLPEITWLKDGHFLDPSSISSDGGDLLHDVDGIDTQPSLSLARLSSRDSGNYTCVATNRHGVVAANWTLNVIENIPLEGPEVFPLEMSNVTAFVGEEATLSCRGTWDSEITPKVMWLRQVSKSRLPELIQNQTFPYKGNHYQVLQPSELVLLENELFMTKLIIRDVHRDDSGIYVCTVSNRYGINVRQANLNVLVSDGETSPILLLSGVAMGVVVLVVVTVAISLCCIRAKSSPLPGPTEWTLIPQQGGGGHTKLQPAPPLHQPRYVIHNSKLRVSGNKEGVTQYPSSVVHLEPQVPQSLEHQADSHERPKTIHQDPSVAGSAFLASHQGTTRSLAAKYEYRKFDII